MRGARAVMLCPVTAAALPGIATVADPGRCLRVGERRF